MMLLRITQQRECSEREMVQIIIDLAQNGGSIPAVPGIFSTRILLSETPRQPVGHQTRHDVGASTGFCGNDKGRGLQIPCSEAFLPCYCF